MSDDTLSDEDKKLFRQMMLGVKPLAKSEKIAHLPKNPSAKSARKQEVPLVPENRYPLSDQYHHTVHADSILSYCLPGIPYKRFRELKNGHIPLQARLDLHGLNPTHARDALCRFIEEQTAFSHRALLIIHGKGGRRNEAPILKNLVNHWLQQLPQILAFHSALPKDGGSGAVYVLLKKAIMT